MMNRVNVTVLFFSAKELQIISYGTFVPCKLVRRNVIFARVYLAKKLIKFYARLSSGDWVSVKLRAQSNSEVAFPRTFSSRRT